MEMPTRVIRDGINSSERVDQLSSEGEIFYRRLLNVVDDFGRFFAHPSQVYSAAFPLRADKFNSKKVNGWILECAEAGLIQAYEVESTKYLQVMDFRQQVRAAKSKFPGPVHGCIAIVHQPCTDVHLGGGGGGGGGASFGDEDEGASSIPVQVLLENNHPKESSAKTTSSPSPGFVRFWDAYPNTSRRSDKAACIRKWNAKNLESIADEIVSHVEACAKSDQWARGYEKGSAAYLNGELWKYPPPSEKGAANGKPPPKPIDTSDDTLAYASAARAAQIERTNAHAAKLADERMKNSNGKANP